MWKKDEAGPEPSVESSQFSEAPGRKAPQRGDRATIGRSISVRGEVSGDEDLLIQGQVDGSVDLGQYSVTVGSDGRVKANISARVVTVEGSVEGDLTAQEQIVLRSSARVHGDIRAPRVVLEDGASFRGLVDMGAEERASTTAGSVKAQKEIRTTTIPSPPAEAVRRAGA